MTKQPPDELHPSDKVQPLDHTITLINVLQDILTFVLHAVQTKPSDPEAWAAFMRLDALRRQLQRNAGQEPTELRDPHGRAVFDKTPEAHP